MAELSGWRANDVVAFEAMRDAAAALTAILLRGSDASQPVSVEVLELRDRVLAADARNRAEVSVLAESISRRITELAESAS